MVPELIWAISSVWAISNLYLGHIDSLTVLLWLYCLGMIPILRGLMHSTKVERVLRWQETIEAEPKTILINIGIGIGLLLGGIIWAV